MKKTTLKKVKSNYQKRLKNTFPGGQPANVDELIDISLTLFQGIKVEGITDDVKDNDMLLFQYGTYDWGKGNYFQFDITRLFIKPDEDEPYQLSMTLFYEPIECKDYNCWSIDFDNLEDLVESIKETKGYQSAKSLTCKKFEMGFEQC